MTTTDGMSGRMDERRVRRVTARGAVGMSLLLTVGGAVAEQIQPGPPAQADAVTPEPARPRNIPGDEFLVLLDDGTRRNIELMNVADGLEAFMASGGNEASSELSGVVAAIAADGDVIASPAKRIRPFLDQGMVFLTDGRRLPGTAVALPASDDDSDADFLPWVHPWLNDVRVPLDEIEYVFFRIADAPGLIELDEADRVVLLNGDVVDGFLVGLNGAVEIEVNDGETRIISIPFDRVAGIRLVNERVSPSGPRAWFERGTVIDVTMFALRESGKVAIKSSLKSNQREMRSMPEVDELIGFVPDVARMLPLIDLDPVGQSPIGHRLFVPEPVDRMPMAVLNLGAIELRGPQTVTWRLPADTTRFVAEAVLPDSEREWGDFVLVVNDGDEEVLRERIFGDRPSVKLNLPLSTRDLAISIESGAKGPVQDVVELRQAHLIRK